LIDIQTGPVRSPAAYKHFSAFWSYTAILSASGVLVGASAAARAADDRGGLLDGSDGDETFRDRSEVGLLEQRVREPGPGQCSRVRQRAEPF
jgi:hypothetical protein